MIQSHAVASQFCALLYPHTVFSDTRCVLRALGDLSSDVSSKPSHRALASLLIGFGSAAFCVHIIPIVN